MLIPKAWPALVLCATLVAAVPAKAELVTLSGALDATQVYVPVYQLDINGQPVLDANGDPIAIGSTNRKPDGSFISTSGATGFATVVVDTVAATIETYFSWAGLTGVAHRAHLHDAPPGHSRLEPPNDRFFHEVIGDVYDETDTVFLRTSVVGGYVDCGSDPNYFTGPYCVPTTGSLHDTLYHINDRFAPSVPYAFADMAAFVVAMKSDGLFLDIHTAAYPGGEIRGQLLFATVPEPASLALLGLAGLAAGAVRQRRPDADAATPGPRRAA